MDRVMKLEIKEIPNAYILISASIKDKQKPIEQLNTSPVFSFLFDGGDIAAEWEPCYGPIQVWTKAH